MALVLVVRTLDLTRWLDQLSLGATTGNLLLVAVLGVTASVSTCMALVGGLVLSLSARHAAQHPNVGTAGKFRPQLLFNLGRVVGFTLLGALIGLVGRIVAFQGSFLTAAIILASVVMGFLGLKLTGISPRLSGFSFTLPAALTKRINGAAESSVRAKAAGKTSDIRGSTANGRGNGRDSRRATNTRTARYSDVNAAGLGVASFFLPCGFTQAVQVYALSTGDPLQAGLVMGVFALGTTPGLVGIGTLGAFARGPRAARMLRAVGVLVIAFTLVNLSGTWRTLVPPAASAISPNTVTADSAPDGIQQAVIKVTGQGYEPEHTVIEAGKPAELIFELEAFGCAAILDAGPLGVPETITLDTDRTTVEIPPLEPGTYSYSCAMGMFWGSVTAK
jgi:sulfite exporter TauE/SafE